MRNFIYGFCVFTIIETLKLYQEALKKYPDHFDTLTGQLKDEGASFEATGPSPDDIPT